MHRKLTLALPALLLAALAGPRPAGAVVVPLSAEIGMGREAAQYVESAFPMSTDPLLIARVQRVGRRVASNCARPDLPFEFHVVDTPDINAFCLPGGFVYVFRGLLQGVPNDDALAFIMGHEIAHATQRHSMKQFEKGQLVRIALSPLGKVLGTFGRDMANMLLQMHFSRADESQADQLGLRTAVSAGFSPDSGVLAMDMLLRLTGKGGGIPEILSSHPATNHRKSAMAALAKELKRAQPLPLAATGAAVPALVWDAPAQAPVATPLFPLATGASWTYRLSSRDGASDKVTVTVIEERPGPTQGIFRVETAYGAGLTNTRWVASAAGAVLGRAGAAGAGEPWRVEWRLQPGDGFAVEGVEKLTVPAGEFTCTRVRRLAADGSAAVEGWFAPGVGLVKCAWLAQGISQELLSYRLPAASARKTVASR